MLLNGDGDLYNESDGLLPVHIHHLGLAAAGEARGPGLDEGNLWRQTNVRMLATAGRQMSGHQDSC